MDLAGGRWWRKLTVRSRSNINSLFSPETKCLIRLLHGDQIITIMSMIHHSLLFSASLALCPVSVLILFFFLFFFVAFRNYRIAIALRCAKIACGALFLKLNEYGLVRGQQPAALVPEIWSWHICFFLLLYVMYMMLRFGDYTFWWGSSSCCGRPTKIFWSSIGLTAMLL